MAAEKLSRLLLLSLLSLSLLAVNAAASDASPTKHVIRVPGDYPSIREAVEAASPGSLILIGPGVYNESVIVENKSGIVLRGVCGETIIRPPGGAAVTMRGSINVSIECLVAEAGGDGVLVEDSRIISLHDIVVRARGGVGVHVSGGEDVSLHNTTVSLGGGLYSILLEGSRNVAITGSSITHSGAGPVIQALGGERLVVTRSYIVIKSRVPLMNTTMNHTIMYLSDIRAEKAAPLIEHGGDVLAITHSPRPLRYRYRGGVYEGFLGNHWEGYGGIDGDGDGVNDEPLYFTGTSIVLDYYPLSSRPEGYEVLGPGSDGGIAAIYTGRPVILAPGAEDKEIAILVHNPGPWYRRIDVDVEAPDGIEASASRERLVAKPYETIRLSVNIGVGNGAHSGLYTVTVKLSDNASRTPIEIHVPVKIEAYPETPGSSGEAMEATIYIVITIIAAASAAVYLLAKKMRGRGNP